ncbi:MAG: sn-glycerol-3-phosphate ABC transporter ATP-binding protein UgpC [Deltaproteobacteria bacterium]|nr:sn-glycerol-3-phosphate ABC transporter ATP-binding protein UgpC [Deltaproteobacteria bacterium]
MADVKIENVRKQFGEVVAVENFSLNIQDGEFIILVGPSGCGKTTILRSIAGLETITSGEIYIDGKPVSKVAPKKRDIAMVFQNYALYPHMNVRSNMAFSLKLKKVPKPKINEIVERTAGLLGMGELLDRKPNELSGGQRQRVALGRAIVRDPKVFLFDEPLSNLDAKLRISMRAELLSLHQRLKTTTVYVTHDQMEAMTMGDRIVVMNNGVIQQVDTPQNVYDNPANQYVAGFIGSPAMNFIDCRISQDQGQYYVVSPGMNLKIPEDKALKLKDRVGQEVSLGLRPEHIIHSNFADQAAPGVSFKGSVWVIEPLGSEKLVYIRPENQETLIARLDPHVLLKIGDVADFKVRMDLAHLFEKTHGRVIF